MNLPFSLPEWMPWWVPMALIVPALLYGLAFLIMPFAVLGLKSRLDTIDLRLDEIQGEIRSLALRLREPARPRRDADELYVDPPARPPIPPAPRGAADDLRAPEVRSPDIRPLGGREERAEPRLNWPR